MAAVAIRGGACSCSSAPSTSSLALPSDARGPAARQLGGACQGFGLQSSLVGREVNALRSQLTASRRGVRDQRPSHIRAADVNANLTDEYSRGRTEQKVKVVAGPYKDKAIKVSVKKSEVSDEEVDNALKAKLAKTHDFERVNFTGSGAKIGHTVRINFEGKYAEGPNNGQLIKGTKANMFELELQPRDDDPWKTFVTQIISAGMGQEESKSFELRFPGDYKAAPLRNVLARFTVTVKEIGVKKPLAKDPRPVDVQREELAASMRADAERRTNELLDAEIRKVLLGSSQADVEKVAASVSWAKFGEKSLQDFKWNLVLEEVARLEKIEFEDTKKYLRSQASVTYV